MNRWTVKRIKAELFRLTSFDPDRTLPLLITQPNRKHLELANEVHNALFLMEELIEAGDARGAADAAVQACASLMGIRSKLEHARSNGRPKREEWRMLRVVYRKAAKEGKKPTRRKVYDEVSSKYQSVHRKPFPLSDDTVRVKWKKEVVDHKEQ